MTAFKWRFVMRKKIYGKKKDTDVALYLPLGRTDRDIEKGQYQ